MKRLVKHKQKNTVIMVKNHFSLQFQLLISNLRQFLKI